MSHSKVRGIIVAVALCLCTALCGCSWMGAPATTEELLVRYVANDDASNAHARAQVDVGVAALGVHAKIPVTADFDMAGDAAHGTVTVGLDDLDTRDYVLEAYAELQDDDLVCYLGLPDEDGGPAEWKSCVVDMTSSIDIFTLVDLLTDAEFTKLAKSSDEQVAFELSVPTSTVLDTAFGLSEEPVSVAGMGEDWLLDAVGDGRVRFDFTDDCLLRSAYTSAMLDLKSAQTNDVSVSMELDGRVELDGYGTVDPASVVVPNEVREAADLTDEPIDVLDVIGADSPLAGAVAR